MKCVFFSPTFPPFSVYFFFSYVVAYSHFPLISCHWSPFFIYPNLQGSELLTKRAVPPSESNFPVLEFVALERYNAIGLVQTIHSSLKDLNKVMKGSALLSPAVQKVAGALLKNEVSSISHGKLDWYLFCHLSMHLCSHLIHSLQKLSYVLLIAVFTNPCTPCDIHLAR